MSKQTPRRDPPASSPEPRQTPTPKTQPANPPREKGANGDAGKYGGNRPPTRSK